MTFKDTGTKRTHCQSTETPFINPITEYKPPRQHLTLSRPIALVRKYFNTSVAKQIGLLSAKSKKKYLLTRYTLPLLRVLIKLLLPVLHLLIHQHNTGHLRTTKVTIIKDLLDLRPRVEACD